MTDTPTQSTEKQEIATAAVKSFRDELSRWESLTLSPIVGKLDDMILSDQEIPDDFTEMEDLGTRRYLYAGLSFFGVDFLDQLFSFLKEKQEELHKAQSRFELLKLKQSITGSLTPTELAELAELEQTVASSTPQTTPDQHHDGQTTGDQTTSPTGGDVDDPTVSNQEPTEEDGSQGSAGEQPTGTEDGMSSIGTAALGSGAIAGTATVAGRALDRARGSVEAVSSRITPEKLNKHIDAYIAMLEHRKGDATLTSRQKNTLQQTIDNFREAKQSSQGLDDLAAWKKLADKNILPTQIFGSLNLSPPTLRAMGDISDNPALLAQLAKTNDSTEIKSLLASADVVVDDTVIDIFRKANTLEDVTGVTHVLANTKSLSKMAKFARAVPFLTAAAAGLDIRVYLETGKEAELIRQTNTLRASNKNSQANFTLSMGMIDAAVGVGSMVAIASRMAAAGPIGWIGLGVAAAGYGIQQVAETAYFDVRNQYLQNTHDYIGQYHTEVKHAIMQATVRGDNSIGLSFTESIGEGINAAWNFHTFGSWEQENIAMFVPQTLEDAYRAMFLMDELDGQIYGYLNYLSFENDPEKQTADPATYQNLTDTYEATNKRVALRMEYITPYLPHSHQPDYQALHDSIVVAQGMNHLDKLIHESSTFADFQTTTNTSLQGAEHIDDYTEKYQAWLTGRDDDLYNKLGNYAQESPQQFAELALSTQQWMIFAGGHEGTDETLLSNAQFVLDFWDYYQINHPDIANTPAPAIIDYVAMDETLRGLQDEELSLSLSQFDHTQLANRFYGNYDVARSSLDQQASDSVGTNIIYEVARQLHQYDGNNTTLDLIQFFSVEKADTLGLYYDDGWYINKDWAFDHSMRIDQWDTRTTEQIIARVAKHDMVDTASERADDWINTEYHQQLMQIIRHEKSYQTPTKKAEISQTILNLAKANQGYILLPDALVTDAIKSGIGNFSETYISYDTTSEQLVILSRDSNDVFDLGDIPVEQEHVAVLRDTLSEKENILVANIDNQMQHLIDLRGIKSWTSHEYELAIPVEVERGLTQLVYDREKTKKSLHTLDPYAAEQVLQQATQSYGKKSEYIYQAILYNISQSMISNDQGGTEILSALRWNTTVPPKGETIEGSIFEWTHEGLIMSTTVGYSFDDSLGVHLAAIIKEHKVGNKTVHELLDSDDTEEFNQGASYVPLLLQAILESKYLLFDDNQKITTIAAGGGSNPLFSRELIIKRFDHLLGLTSTVPEGLPTSHEPTERPQASIERQTTLTTTINTSIARVTHDSYGRQHSVDRGSERKRITYNPQTQSIESRDQHLPLVIEDDVVGIPHFEFPTPLDEVVRFANFMNKLHYDYPDGSISGWEMGISGALQADLTDRYRDVNLLSPYAINQYFPTLGQDPTLFLTCVEKNYEQPSQVLA